MSNEESKSIEAKPDEEADDRIEETPTHWEIQIYEAYAEPEGTAQEIADIKTIEELPNKAPPSMVKMRRKVYAGDFLVLDYCEGAEIARTMQMAAVLTDVPFNMIKRMDWSDYCHLRDKATAVMQGKG